MKLVPTNRSEWAFAILFITAVPLLFYSAVYAVADGLHSPAYLANAMDELWFRRWRVYQSTVLLAAAFILPFLRNWYGLLALLSLLVSFLLLVVPITAR